ncbi:MAG: cyclopropane-fatty-acyl-phospholipid synthase family protein [Candidatus Moranbacteria bacterium]|nr:cyclopropane-fatty-acyl-phospholipid synthase family protein [Candidatus Moranbacteria bacterium]
MLTKTKKFAWKKIRMQLKSLQYGTLTVVLPDDTRETFMGQEGIEEEAVILIRDWSFFTLLLKRGDIGFGEAYIEDLWSTDDLPGLLTVLARNTDHYNENLYAGNFWSRLGFRLYQWYTRNTKLKSKANIKAHYDVGNDFYKLWLDETMMYSSALFTDGAESLADAQRNKNARILELLGEAKSIWEIGCGWGGFAKMAMEKGKLVYGISLSKEQLRYGNKLLAKELRDSHSELVFEDYRDTKGEFDAVVSIEMIEAVGQEFWSTYFSAIASHLRPGGKAVVQVIYMPSEDAFDYYARSADFIRQYTFPGGMLLSPDQFRSELDKAGLLEEDWYTFGQDYAKTLSLWLEKLESSREAILDLGYSEEFIRSWRYYMAICIAGFRVDRINVAQVTFSKPLV